MPSARARALASPTFRALYGAQCLSLLATGLVTLALGLLAYEIAGDEAGAVLGGALALKMAAYVLAPPFVAALASALPRRGFLVALDLGRAAAIFALPFVETVFQIYALVFATQVLAAAFTPTFQAVIPDLFDDEKDYGGALSLSRLAYDVEGLASPAIASLLLGLFAFDALFVLAAAAFLLSALLVWIARPPSPSHEPERAPFAERLFAGAKRYWAAPELRGLLALYAAIASASAFTIVLTVVRVKAGLGAGDLTLTAYFAAAGAGSIAIALVWPALHGRFALRSLALWAGATIAVAFALWAAIDAALGASIAGDLALWCALGAGAALAQMPGGVLIRRRAEGDARAALFAAHFAATHAVWFVTYLLAGQLSRLVELWAIGAAFALLAALGVLAGKWIWPAE